MWSEKKLRDYFASRPRLFEAGAHLCEPVLLKILAARYDAEEDETQFCCLLGRRAAAAAEEPRTVWLSRQDLLLNPEHALKLEHYEESGQRNPALEGQRRKAVAAPAAPSRRRSAAANADANGA